LIILNFEKLLYAEAEVIGMVNKIRSEITMLRKAVKEPGIVFKKLSAPIGVESSFIV
jgi:hypothetical protein